MSNPLLPVKAAETKRIVLHEDYPFREDVMSFLKQEAKATRIIQADSYKETRLTVIQESTYIKAPFTKVYQGKVKTLLNHLGPYDSMLFLYIVVNLDYNSQQVLIDYKEVNMDRKRLAKSLLELTGLSIIRKVQEKKQLYWVNLSILIVGNIASKDNLNESVA